MKISVLNGVSSIGPSDDMNGSSDIDPMDGTSSISPMQGYGEDTGYVEIGNALMQGMLDEPDEILVEDLTAAIINGIWEDDDDFDYPEIMDGLPFDIQDEIDYKVALALDDPNAEEMLQGKGRERRKAKRAARKKRRADRRARKDRKKEIRMERKEDNLVRRKAKTKNKQEGKGFFDKVGGALGDWGKGQAGEIVSDMKEKYLDSGYEPSDDFIQKAAESEASFFDKYKVPILLTTAVVIIGGIIYMRNSGKPKKR